VLLAIVGKLRSEENSDTIETDTERVLSPVLRDVIAQRLIDLEASVLPAGKAKCDWKNP
jgi:hypothetical protein